MLLPDRKPCSLQSGMRLMCHALIIEDDFLAADYIAALAAMAGATSSAIALTEDEAVASAKVNRPHIILSDVHLQSGSGPSAVNRIRGSIGSVPVLYVTASPQSCHEMSSGDDIVAKPFQRDALIEAFCRLAPDSIPTGPRLKLSSLFSRKNSS